MNDSTHLNIPQSAGCQCDGLHEMIYLLTNKVSVVKEFTAINTFFVSYSLQSLMVNHIQYYKIRNVQRTFSRAYSIKNTCTELASYSQKSKLIQINSPKLCDLQLEKMFVVFSEFCNIENIDSRIKSSKFFQNTSILDIQRPCIITLNAHFV